MMKKIIILFVALFSIIRSANAADDYDVYLLIGQSNMAGRGELTARDTTECIEGVWLLDSLGMPVPAVAPLNKFSTIRKDIGLQGYNPGVMFGRLMHQRTGRPVLLVVNARGGSSIGQWMPGDKHHFHDEAIRRTRQAMQYGTLKGILWHQGETDIQKHTHDYAGKFETMITALRDSLGQGEVPVVSGQVGRWHWAPEADIRLHNDSVVPSLAGRVPNCRYVTSHNLGRRYKDNERDPHFGRKAQMELGRRYADAMTGMLSRAFIAKFKGGKAAAISFTFDDGDRDHYTLVAPQLERRGWRGTFWIIGNKVDRGDSIRPRATWQQLREMAQNGHEISNHSFTHGKLVLMSPEQAARDIHMNDSAIIRNVGVRPLTFCYPFNATTDWLIDIARTGRVGTRLHQTGIGQVNNKMTPDRLKAWVDDAVSHNDWAVAMIHGITTGYDMWHNPDDLWNFMDYVKENESRIWVATFKDAAEYQAVRDNTVLTVEPCGNGLMRLVTKCPLDAALFNCPVTVALNGLVEPTAVKAVRNGEEIPTESQDGTLLVDMLPNDTIILSHKNF